MQAPDSAQGSSAAAPPAPPPSCSPLDTVQQLLEWAPCDRDEPARATVPLGPSPRLRHGGPRLLACHDLAGGYHEDRWAQGCSLDPAAAAAASPPAYFLHRWHALDAFVYFSHRLVTIPPVGWVNSAHTHGVPVLGTLITEWDAGAAACQQLFGTAAAAEAAARKLAAIAAHFGFDGWTINIENAVDPAHIPHLLHFLRVLTEQMREVAPACRHRVIWYDAVTTEGKLCWQNTLNTLNRPFFDACDAIWINYTWRRSTPATVRKEAGARAADVYMGVDCFGRGTYGGGGFRCDTALRACLAHGLSAALFATAWPYEADCRPAAPACWLERDALFWERIERAWEAGGGTSSSGTSGGSTLSAPSGSTQLPLFSNVSVGAGRAFYQGGRPVGGPWHNLSLQALQPLLRVQLSSSSAADSSSGGSGSGGSPASGGSGSPAGGGGASWLAPLHSLCGWLLRSLHAWLWWREAPCPVRAGISDELAFSGGSALRVGGRLPPGQQATVQLFRLTAQLPPGGVSVRWVTRGGGGAEQRLALRLAPAASGGGAAAAGGAVGGCVTLELLPTLSLPESAPAASEAAAAEAWSAGPAVTAAGTSCSRAPCHQASAAAAAASSSSVPGTAEPGVAELAAEWTVWHYRLPPSILSAALPPAPVGGHSARSSSSSGGGGDCSGGGAGEGGSPLVLVGVDVLLRRTAGQQDRDDFEVHLGEVCIEAAPPSGWPQPPASVQGLQCSSLQVVQEPAGAPSGPGAAGERLLSAQLAWQPPPSASPRCFHVWCSFPAGGGSSGAAAQTELRWLGAACANSYRVASLLVRPGATAVHFAVQPEGRDGQVQELSQAALVAASLATASSS